jgi:hypothetical protein
MRTITRNNITNVQSTARHAIHLQFDISAYAAEIRALKEQERIRRNKSALQTIHFRLRPQCIV